MYILQLQDIDGNLINEAESVTYDTVMDAYYAANHMFMQGLNISRAVVEDENHGFHAFTTNMFLNSIYNPYLFSNHKPVYGSYLGQLSHFYEKHPYLLPYKSDDYDAKLIPFYEEYPTLLSKV